MEKTEEDPFNLTNGPGKLCTAMGIDKRLNGLPFYFTPVSWKGHCY